MTDNVENTDVNVGANAELKVDEKTALQERLKKMNVSFHPSAGVDTLRKKLNDALEGKTSTANTDEPAPVESSKPTMAERRKRLKEEALSLVRVRITNMNPNKKGWPGEVFTVSNAFISVKKMIPYQDAEDGYHVPKILLNLLREKKFQDFVRKKNENGQAYVEGKLVPEFAIEELPPLTEEELKDLAKRQAMSGAVS